MTELDQLRADSRRLKALESRLKEVFGIDPAKDFDWVPFHAAMKRSVLEEREACARVVEHWGFAGGIAESVRNREAP